MLSLLIAWLASAAPSLAQVTPADSTPGESGVAAPAESDPATPADAEANGASSALVLTATQVVPANPGPETLCRLRVLLENQGERAASALRFTVAVDGIPLAVYDRQLFVETLPPGEVTRVDLFNFWTSEIDRPPPADGSLEVEVTLEEARYLLRDVAEDGTEILTLQEPVPGLPTSLSLSVPLTPEG